MQDAAEQMMRDLLADKARKREQASRLWAMTAAQRVDAMRRGRLTFWQLHHWARHAPHEVPTPAEDNPREPEATARLGLATPLAHRPRPPLASITMVSERQIPLKITIDNRPERSETIAYSAGAYVLALATTLPDRALSLHSTYTGAAGAGTLASHLLLASDAYQAISAEHDHGVLPLTHQRRRLLYDHLQNLKELLADIGLDGRPHVENHAIAAIEP